MADTEDHDLVDYDEEEEEENVVTEKTAEGDAKEVKKWVQKKHPQPQQERSGAAPWDEPLFARFFYGPPAHAMLPPR